MIARHMTVAMVCLALAGCVASPSFDAAPVAEAPISDDGERVLDPLRSCRASGARPLVGQVADAATIANAKRATGASTVRVLRPGDARSMDYRTDRLNLDVDAKAKIVRAYCG